MTEDERAIRQVIDTWMAASKDGDIETVLSLMTKDVVFMVPGQEPFGRQMFAEASKGMAGVQMEGTCKIVELQVLGEWGIHPHPYRHDRHLPQWRKHPSVRLHSDTVAQGSRWPVAAGP